MRELSLFTGGGGSLLAGKLLGWHPVACCEWLPYNQRSLQARIDDGLLPQMPIYPDIRELDGRPWAGKCDVITGGFPCTDISGAKTHGKRLGLKGEHSGLWYEMARIIDEVRPAFVLTENSSRLKTNGLDTILDFFREIGYATAWVVLPASHVGAPHRRSRLWLVSIRGDVETAVEPAPVVPVPWWPADVALCSRSRAHAPQRRVATGNGWVPQCAVAAWHVLAEHGKLLKRKGVFDFPTPTTRDTDMAPSMRKWPAHVRLQDFVWTLTRDGLLPTPACTGGSNRGGTGGRVGHWRPSVDMMTKGVWPEFREWMMGWPIGWTSLEPMLKKNMKKWLGYFG